MEDKLDLIASLGKITFFLMLILSVFLLTVKTTEKTPNRLLGTMLLLIAFDLSGFFMGGWFEARPALNSVKTASSLLQMPLFYGYVLAVCYSDFRLKIGHWIHGILASGFLVLFWTIGLSRSVLGVYEVLGEVQWFGYMIAVFVLLNRRKKIYRDNYSRPSSQIYRWLFQFAVISSIGHSFVLLRWIITLTQPEHGNPDINVLISFSTLFIITWFVFKALYHPVIFTGVKSSQQPMKSQNGVKLSAKQGERLKKDAEKLQRFMTAQKPYLDFELTLQKLATQIGMPEKDLSLALNQELGKHFFDFVNDYRIAEAKTLLSSTEHRHLTVLEVLYQVGFNSKSSFYTAFKKATQQTPSAYRKGQLVG